MRINRKKTGLFLALTFGADWLLAGIFYLAGGRFNILSLTGGIMAAAYMFVPMLAAIIVQKLYHEPVIRPLGVSFKFNRWFLVAWLLPPLAALATLLVSLLWPGVDLSWEMRGMFERFGELLPPDALTEMQRQAEQLPVHPFWIILVQGLVAGLTVNAVFGFGEELGWRGFLQKELAGMNFWKSSVLIGFIWGIWHAPLIIQGYNYPQHPLLGVGMMIIWTLLLSPLFSYVRLKAQSVIAAAIMHGTLNGTAGLAIIILTGGNDLLVGLTGLAGFIVLFALNLGLFLGDPSLRSPGQPGATPTG